MNRSSNYLAFALLLPAQAPADMDFSKEILPILQTHCLKCHRAEHEEDGRVIKPKGGIQLDAAWAIQKGKKGIVLLAPNDPAKSHLAAVITLPRSDEKAMPPNGKGEPLTEAEVALLKAWIAAGADFGGWEGNLEGKPASIAAAPARLREHDAFFRQLAEGLPQPAADFVSGVKAAGAQVSALGAGDPLVRVDFLSGVSRCDDAAIMALGPLNEHIAELDLARTKITDEALKSIARMPRLAKLDLRQTQVTDTGIGALTACQNLRSINLFGTPLTDAGLSSLGKMRSLKKITLSETKVTPQGVYELKTQLTGAEVIFEDAFAQPAVGVSPASAP